MKIITAVVEEAALAALLEIGLRLRISSQLLICCVTTLLDDSTFPVHTTAVHEWGSQFASLDIVIRHNTTVFLRSALSLSQAVDSPHFCRCCA